MFSNNNPLKHRKRRRVKKKKTTVRNHKTHPHIKIIENVSWYKQYLKLQGPPSDLIYGLFFYATSCVYILDFL